MKAKTLIKLIACNFFFLSFLAGIAQSKPEKTFDHEKFAKKVYGNFSAGMDQSIFLPDDKALEFISVKTGKKIEYLKTEREQNKKYISEDKLTLQKENAGGKMVMGVELVKVDHPQLTMGNIIINAQGMKIVFGNCIQTDITWVLGDYMCLEGKVPVRKKEVTKAEMAASFLVLNEKNYSVLTTQEWMVWHVIKVNGNDTIIKSGAQVEKNDFYNLEFTLEKDNKCYGGYKKGKSTLREWVKYNFDQASNNIGFSTKEGAIDKFEIHSISESKLILTNVMEGARYYYVASKYVVTSDNNQASANTNSKGNKLYIDPTPRGLVDGANFIDPSNFNKPTKGFYIDKDGNKVTAVIKYQDPEILCNNVAPLQLYKTAYNDPGFINDEKNNANGVKAKSDILAFAVNGHVYVRVEWDNWGILLKEGAVRECVQLKKATDGTSKTGYHKGDWYKKHSGKSLPSANLVINFAKSMSEFLDDYPELAEKIKNKEEGYTMLKTNFIIEEYNKWYDEKNPGKLKYIYAE